LATPAGPIDPPAIFKAQVPESTERDRPFSCFSRDNSTKGETLFYNLNSDHVGFENYIMSLAENMGLSICLHRQDGNNDKDMMEVYLFPQELVSVQQSFQFHN
jgi:choline kinase